MTVAKRIARLRANAENPKWIEPDDVLALCDDYETLDAFFNGDNVVLDRGDYETLAARGTLTDEETEAVRRWLRNTVEYRGLDWEEVRAVLRRLLGETP